MKYNFKTNYFHLWFLYKITCAFLLQENEQELSELNTFEPRKITISNQVSRVPLKLPCNLDNGVCWIEWDRQDIKMNKLTAVTLEVYQFKYLFRNKHMYRHISMVQLKFVYIFRKKIEEKNYAKKDKKRRYYHIHLSDLYKM